jgi:hypothetical protein
MSMPEQVGVGYYHTVIMQLTTLLDPCDFVDVVVSFSVPVPSEPLLCHLSLLG